MTDAMRVVETAAEGLAFEAGLFAGTDPHARLWRAQKNGLVCPRAYSTRAGFDEAAEASKCAGWPVSLRATGGGAVPQGPGVANLVLAFDAPGSFTIEDGYRLLARIITEGLDMPQLETGNTPGSFCDGAWNLSADGRKLVGTAQRWRPVQGGRPRVLAHAMILMANEIGPGAEAVSQFHQGLGQPSVQSKAHTSVAAEMGLTTLPDNALHATALTQLSALTN